MDLRGIGGSQGRAPQKEPPMQVIKDRWYAVLESSELSDKRPLARRRFGIDMVFWRDGGFHECTELGL